MPDPHGALVLLNLWSKSILESTFITAAPVAPATIDLKTHAAEAAAAGVAPPPPSRQPPYHMPAIADNDYRSHLLLQTLTIDITTAAATANTTTTSPAATLGHARRRLYRV